jgi:hypothetical protein
MSTAAAVARKAAAAALAAASGGAKVAPAAPKGKVVIATPRKDAASLLGYATQAESSLAIAPIVAGLAKEAEALMKLRTSPMFFNPALGTMSPRVPTPTPPQPRGGPLPSHPPTAMAGRTFNKRLRLHPHWKLRPVRRWVDFVPFIKELTICYDPGVEGFVGARELGRQALSPKVMAKFSGCAVKVFEKDDGSHAVVHIQWVRGGGLEGTHALFF